MKNNSAQRTAFILICAFLTASGLLIFVPQVQAQVPTELVDELRPVVDEALASDNAEARAWALRSLALLGGRDVRTTLTDHQDNADLMVRVFAGLGLVQQDRNEGREILATELASSGPSSRQRILNRWIRHLSADDQHDILEEVIESTTDSDVLTDVIWYVVRYGQGEVFELLLELTDDSHTNEREVILEALAATNRTEAMDLASELAGSREVADRLFAASIADSVGTEDGRRLLESLLEDDDSTVSMAAAISLAPRGVTQAYDVLLAFAQTAEPTERIAALEAIRNGNPTMVIYDTLISMLEQATDVSEQRLLWETLAATGSDQAFDTLSTMATGDIFDDRIMGVAGLGYSGREAAVTILGDVLLGGSGPDLRSLAAEALGNLGLQAAAEPLLEALDRERGGEVKVAVVAALAHTPSDDVMWPLAFLLTSDDADVVTAALDSLGALGATTVASQVENTALTYRDENVRWHATLVLFALDPEVGQIRLMQALDRPPEGFMSDIDGLPEGPRLEAYSRLLGHSDPDIRLMAATRVRNLPGEGLDMFRELVDPTTQSDMRQYAVALLTANRDPIDLEIFTGLMDSSHQVMRSQSIEAVAELAMPETEELLRGLLDSTDLERRAMAVYGLWNIGLAGD